VALNENEQRILEEIERRFYAHDPDSARRIESTTLPRYLARNCRWATLGLLAGLAILVVGFASSWILGVFGFLIMVGSAVLLIQNLRRMGRFGMQQMAKSMSGRNLGEAIEEAARRFRQRFRSDGDAPE
jgi:hypothetical protein